MVEEFCRYGFKDLNQNVENTKGIHEKRAFKMAEKGRCRDSG